MTALIERVDNSIWWISVEKYVEQCNVLGEEKSWECVMLGRAVSPRLQCYVVTCTETLCSDSLSPFLPWKEVMPSIHSL